MRFPIFLTLVLTMMMTYNATSQVEVGQNVSKAVIIETIDGSVIYGYIVEDRGNTLLIESNSLGSVVIQREQITKINYIDNVENIIFDSNGFPVDFHNSVHYFVFPSGYGLKKGQSYYENVYIFWNSVSYGLTDNFMVTGGVEVASLLFAGNVPLFFASPKFSIPFSNQKGAFGINATILSIPGSGDFQGLGFLSSSLTLGSRNNNFTLGLGAGFNFDGGITDEVIPMTLSGMIRVSEKISLITENWVIFQNDFGADDYLASLGLRIHFKKLGNALNIGLVRPLDFDSGGFVAIPVISATVALNN